MTRAGQKACLGSTGRVWGTRDPGELREPQEQLDGPLLTSPLLKCVTRRRADRCQDGGGIGFQVSHDPRGGCGRRREPHGGTRGRSPGAPAETGVRSRGSEVRRQGPHSARGDVGWMPRDWGRLVAVTPRGSRDPQSAPGTEAPCAPPAKIITCFWGRGCHLGQ